MCPFQLCSLIRTMEAMFPILSMENHEYEWMNEWMNINEYRDKQHKMDIIFPVIFPVLEDYCTSRHLNDKKIKSWSFLVFTNVTVGWSVRVYACMLSVTLVNLANIFCCITSRADMCGSRLWSTEYCGCVKGLQNFQRQMLRALHRWNLNR